MTLDAKLAPETRLQGRVLTAARAVCVAFLIYATLVFLIALPARWAELVHPTPTTLAHLNALGWSVAPYAVYSLTTEAIFTGVYLIVGLIIFARRSNDGGALVTALFLVAFGVGNQTITPTLTALSAYPFGKFVFEFGGFAAWVTLPLFFYLFPNGRFVPAWTRVAALFWSVLCIPWNFMVNTPFYPPGWPPVLFFLILLPMFGTFLGSPIYRYWRVSNTVERQQTKWVTYSFVMMISLELIGLMGVGLFSDFNAIAYLNPAIGEPPTSEIFAAVLFSQGWLRVIWLILPLALAFSILRYRLWDIDILIRRTLQYSLISGLLALTYFGLVVVLQNLFTVVSGQSSAVVVVLSTLAIAALFFPLRNRVQDFIDRRFYRKKYDAAKVIAEFAATCRDETDLEKLTARLVEVVEETMQPESVSLWLKPTGDRSARQREAALTTESARDRTQ